jgi:trehalose PTS system EIIBC or EIIBCA component
MAKYQADAEKLLHDIGGKENIAAVSHCATRMRFVLNDPGKADEKAIEDIPSVKGMFTNAGQFQVIIGNDVSTFITTSLQYLELKGFPKNKEKQLQNKTFIPFNVLLPF